MMKWLKKIAIVLVVILVGVQFIPANVNQQDYIPKTDFRHVYNVPNNVMSILQTSCYDCHSNNTKYPWYSNIQPIRLMMDHHVEEGMKELNFSEFGNYSERRKRNKLRAISEQIEKGKMPLPSYLWLHSDAKLSNEEKKILMEFISSLKN